MFLEEPRLDQRSATHLQQQCQWKRVRRAQQASSSQLRV
jgi:hypothetical protein